MTTTSAMIGTTTAVVAMSKQLWLWVEPQTASKVTTAPLCRRQGDGG
jgi:hypothetical protein